MNNIIFNIIFKFVLILAGLTLCLYSFVIFIKLKNIIIAEKISKLEKYTEVIIYRTLFYLKSCKYDYMLCDEYVLSLDKLKKIKDSKIGFHVLDECFQNHINNNELEIIDIALEIGILRDIDSKFKSKQINNISNACRLAGLYRQKQYVPNILNSLKYFSGDIQIQALTALSRIGNIEAFIQAFLKIDKFVIINLYIIYEIINMFTGNKIKLYERVFETKKTYICKIFIDCMNESELKLLKYDLYSFLNCSENYLKISLINALSLYKDDDNIKVIYEFLQDEDWSVKWAAGNALGIIENAE